MLKFRLLTVFLYLLIVIVVLQIKQVEITVWIKGEKTSVCKIPDFHPLDLDVWQYIKVPQPLNCGYPQLPLTYVDRDTIYINETAKVLLKRNSSSIADVRCTYSSVKRARNGSDNHVDFVGATELKSGTRLTEEFVWVQCYAFPGNYAVYTMGHAIVQPKPAKKAIGRENTVSVFVLVFDSMSRLNFMRQMPKSYQVLLEDFGAVFLKGLNKVGDNTFPNMMVLLSGQAERNVNLRPNEDFSPYFVRREDSLLDDVPIVWKNFSEHGYTTLYTEDEPHIVAFNDYENLGFGQQPTDYYPRPHWLALHSLVGGKFASSDYRCYANVPKHEFLLNYSRDFLLLMKEEKRPYFALAHSNSLSHYYINEIKILDYEFANYIRDLKYQEVFENAVVVVMGDHGNRYDDFRATPKGRVEDRMPLLAISLPKSLQHLENNLKANSEVLTSWYDLHELLLDIATGNTNFESRKRRHGKRGQSLLRPIPAGRPCFEIGVPTEYCVCQNDESVNTTEPRVTQAAEILIRHVNAFVEKKDKRKLCAFPLELNQTLSAFLVPTGANSESAHVRLAVSVFPSGAQLEAMVKLSKNKTGSAGVVGEVSRINHYGNQSACVSDAKLRLYCYCNSQL